MTFNVVFFLLVAASAANQIFAMYNIYIFGIPIRVRHEEHNNQMLLCKHFAAPQVCMCSCEIAPVLWAEYFTNSHLRMYERTYVNARVGGSEGALHGHTHGKWHRIDVIIRAGIWWADNYHVYQ